MRKATVTKRWLRNTLIATARAVWALLQYPRWWAMLNINTY